MAKRFPTIEDKHLEFIERQKIFFAATAAEGTRINISPRPTTALRVIDRNTVCWLDLTGSGASWETRAEEDPMIHRDGLARFASMYVGSADPRAPLASPLFAELAGLPPMLVQVGTAEVLLDDSRVFAERARAAGVDVTLEVWDEMIHVWHAFAPGVPESVRAIDRIGEYLRAHLPT